MTGALVTGAAQGLGKAIAKGFFEAGYHVALTDIDGDAVVQTAKEISPTGERVCALPLDVTKKSEFEKQLGTAVDAFGRVDVLVNNAAMTLTTPVMEISEDEFDAVTAVNQKGTFLGCQVFGQHFASQGYGRIINLGSLAGQNGGTATGAHYASSKAAIMLMTKIFAKQLANDGVTVNAIAPGPIDLPSVRAAVPVDKLEKIINDMIPVKKLGDADFVASLIVKMASPEAEFITGTTWDINGGISMR